MTILTDLLAMDALASRYGCGINPRLKAAIETDLRFPAKAASPAPDGAGPARDAGGNVLPFPLDPPTSGRKTA
ncbi:hypothetical protein [Maritimibacter sp. DP1N21-5]|uniref:hypothetical protein n=1 Tax=Maritimibacter sp. DP1N21-5 TaxID=2836867 RepID=UPI001C473DB5|nr:hypothetical protein [Maritimibacter sp. DP1N21-5]MBV7407902.1 hypothetical protein [Maritimibacter sp. DP1N21-5]